MCCSDVLYYIYSNNRLLSVPTVLINIAVDMSTWVKLRGLIYNGRRGGRLFKEYFKVLQSFLSSVNFDS